MDSLSQPFLTLLNSSKPFSTPPSGGLPIEIAFIHIQEVLLLQQPVEGCDEGAFLPLAVEERGLRRSSEDFLCLFVAVLSC